MWKWMLLVVAGAGAIAWGTRDRWAEPKPVPVRVTIAATRPVEETVTAASVGMVKTDREVACSAELTARVVRIHAREGAVVEAGQSLIEMDHATTDAALAASEADIAVARSELARARTAAHNAGDDFGFIERQRHEAIVSEQDLTRARSARDNAVDAVAVAEARVKQIEAARANLLVTLTKATLLAPFSGTLTRLHVEEGETVMTGTPMCELMNLAHLYVQVPVDEIDVGKLKLNQPVRLYLEAYPDETFPGAVRRIPPIITTTLEKNRTAEVEVSVENGHGRFRVGMSADVTVVTASKPSGIVIPTKSIRNRSSVLVVENGRILSRNIRAGLTNWATTEILDGLKPGDEVVSILELEESESPEGRAANVLGREEMPKLR